MGQADYQDPGNWNAICSMCGAKRKASELVKNWQGQWRCVSHNEPRQDQDFVRAIADVQTPPWVQRPIDSFVAVCSPNDQTAIPRRAIPSCVKPGYIAPGYDSTAPLLD